MRVSLKTKTSATKSAPEQQHGGEGNYQQRDQLLPIHDGKITPKFLCATRDLHDWGHLLLAESKQKGRAVEETDGLRAWVAVAA